MGFSHSIKLKERERTCLKQSLSSMVTIEAATKAAIWEKPWRPTLTRHPQSSALNMNYRYLCQPARTSTAMHFHFRTASLTSSNNWALQNCQWLRLARPARSCCTIWAYRVLTFSAIWEKSFCSTVTMTRFDLLTVTADRPTIGCWRVWPSQREPKRWTNWQSYPSRARNSRCNARPQTTILCSRTKDMAGSGSLTTCPSKLASCGTSIFIWRTQNCSSSSHLWILSPTFWCSTADTRWASAP